MHNMVFLKFKLIMSTVLQRTINVPTKMPYYPIGDKSRKIEKSLHHRKYMAAVLPHSSEFYLYFYQHFSSL